MEQGTSSTFTVQDSEWSEGRFMMDKIARDLGLKDSFISGQCRG